MIFTSSGKEVLRGFQPSNVLALVGSPNNCSTSAGRKYLGSTATSSLPAFKEFNINSARTRWYIKLTFIVSSAMLIVSLMGLPRAMWIGIACMSVCLPFSKDVDKRIGNRALFNVVGCAIFAVMYIVLPESMYPYIGMIGGIGVGYSAGYAWQTAFNTFGALSIAAGLFGMPYAVALRIGLNAAGAAYTWLCDKVLERIHSAVQAKNASVVE